MPVKDPAPANGRRLTDQGRERKQQLVDAAAVLFAERGYAATRISDICEAAGAAKGLFYWYFPTKRDLFSELVVTMRRRLRRAQASAMDPGAPAIIRIRQGVVASVSFITDHASYFSFVQVERSDPQLAAAVSAGSDVYVRDVAELVIEATNEGSIDTDDPMLSAHGVVGTVWSFTEAWRQGHIDVAADQLAVFVGDWIVGALTGPAPARVSRAPARAQDGGPATPP